MQQMIQQWLLSVERVQTALVPEGSEFLAVRSTDSGLCLVFRSVPGRPLGGRCIVVVGIGEFVFESDKYIGSAQLTGPFGGTITSLVFERVGG